MSNEQRHIIKRQILEVEVGSAGINGQEVQQRLSEAYRDRVIPALEQTLNRLSDGERWISIDRLEIDLGELSLDGLDGNFSQKVEEQLFRVIRERMYTYHHQKELTAQGISTRTADDGNVTVKTSAESKTDLLSGFLKTGRIRWNAGMQASSKPVSDLLEELLEKAPADAANLLKRELRHSLQRTRFILQMPDHLIRKAVTVCINPTAAGSGKRSPAGAGTLAGFAASVIEALNRRELHQRWNSSALRTRIWGLVIDRTLLQSRGSAPAGMEENIHDLLDGLIYGRGDGATALPQPQRFLKLLADELPSTAAAREPGFAGRLPAIIRRYADLNRQKWGRQMDDRTGGDADVPAETKHSKEMADRKIDGRMEKETPDGWSDETAQTADKKREGDRDRGGSTEESDSPDSGPAYSEADAGGKDVPGPAGIQRAREERGPDTRKKSGESATQDGDEPGKKKRVPDQTGERGDTGERQRPDPGGTDTGDFESLSRSGEQSASEDSDGPSGAVMRDKDNSGDGSRQKPESEENRSSVGDDQIQKQEEQARPQATDEAAETGVPPEELHRTYEIGEKADEAWVQNAGLVLLHPFLVRFFDQTGLVEEKQFVNQNARVRAVHLLQYIVTGEQESPEQELFLNKLLCGLEPEYPVPFGVELTRQENEESDNLLKSVVGHWKALKKSSPDAVRTTFLRREGLVSREGMHGGWKVAIERNTFDVLLDRLPWGLSMIKMPWNSYLIHVEW